MRKRTASGKAHPVGGNHFGVFPWVFVSLRRSFTYRVFITDLSYGHSFFISIASFHICIEQDRSIERKKKGDWRQCTVSKDVVSKVCKTGLTAVVLL